MRTIDRSGFCRRFALFIDSVNRQSDHRRPNQPKRQAQAKVQHPATMQSPRLGNHVGLIPTTSGTGNHLDPNRQRFLEFFRRDLERFVVSAPEESALGRSVPGSM